MAATKYGDASAWNVIISNTYTGSTGSETPRDNNGDTWFYLLVAEINIDDSFLQKIKETSTGGSYSSKDGKMGLQIPFGDAFIKTSTNMASIRFQLRYRHRAGSLPLYIWYYNTVASVYVALSMNQAGEQTKYCKGYLLTAKWRQAGGDLWYLKNMTWKECLT